MSKPFIFTVAMLAELTGQNPQYLSKKVRSLVEDPNIKLQAVLRSNKEGYQIPEEEVLRCFNKVTEQQVQRYKEEYSPRSVYPRVRKLTSRGEEWPSDSEMDLLYNWRIYLAGLSPAQANTPETRLYLEGEEEKLRRLKEEKLKEFAVLEKLIKDCDEMIEKIRERLMTMPQDGPKQGDQHE